MNSMGNLEKLGILVIVILVVVVGVVAITPKDRVDEALFPEIANAPSDSAVGETIDSPTRGDGIAPGDRPAPSDSWGRPVAGNGAGEATSTDVSKPVAGTSPLPTATPPGTFATVPVAPPEPPAERTYVVRAGDTLSEISSRELGTQTRWREILEANVDVLHGSDKLKAGMALRIPAKAAPASSESSAPAPATATGTAKTYTVKKGDSLAAIARRELGSESRWKKILEANTDVLSSPEKLQPGMVLKIPAAN